jgi:hypothetical protein
MKFTSYLVLFCTKLEIFMVHKKKKKKKNDKCVVGGCCAASNNHKATK